MASVNNYLFHSMSTLEDDVCYLTERNIQNMKHGSYLVTNHFKDECGLKKSLDVATQQPSMYVNGGYNNTGYNGSCVDVDSSLKNGQMMTNDRSRLNLQTRPFVTVPFLGRGPHRPIEEAVLQQGEQNINRKTNILSSEVSFIPYKNYPLLSNIEKEVQNPRNLVEDSAVKGWVRGGMSSRDYIRDQQYH